MIEFRLEDGGQLPSKGSEGAAGFDIKSNMVEYIAPNERKLLSTGVYLNRLPSDTYLRIAPRSKLIPEKTTPCYVVDVTDEGVYSETARGDSGIDSEEERR